MKNYTKLATSMTLAIGLGMLVSPSLMAQGTPKNYGQCISTCAQDQGCSDRSDPKCRDTFAACRTQCMDK